MQDRNNSGESQRLPVATVIGNPNVDIPLDYYNPEIQANGILDGFSGNQGQLTREVLNEPVEFLTKSVAHAIIVYGKFPEDINKLFRQTIHPGFATGEYRQRIYEPIKSGAEQSSNPPLLKLANDLLGIRSMYEGDPEVFKLLFPDNIARIEGPEREKAGKLVMAMTTITSEHVSEVMRGIEQHVQMQRDAQNPAILVQATLTDDYYIQNQQRVLLAASIPVVEVIQDTPESNRVNLLNRYKNEQNLGEEALKTPIFILGKSVADVVSAYSNLPDNVITLLQRMAEPVFRSSFQGGECSDAVVELLSQPVNTIYNQSNRQQEIVNCLHQSVSLDHASHKDKVHNPVRLLAELIKLGSEEADLPALREVQGNIECASQVEKLAKGLQSINIMSKGERDRIATDFADDISMIPSSVAFSERQKLDKFTSAVSNIANQHVRETMINIAQEHNLAIPVVEAPGIQEESQQGGWRGAMRSEQRNRQGGGCVIS